MRKRVGRGGASASKLPFSVFGVNCTPLNSNCWEIIINKAWPYQGASKFDLYDMYT